MRKTYLSVRDPHPRSNDTPQSTIHEYTTEQRQGRKTLSTTERKQDFCEYPYRSISVSWRGYLGLKTSIRTPTDPEDRKIVAQPVSCGQGYALYASHSLRYAGRSDHFPSLTSLMYIKAPTYLPILLGVSSPLYSEKIVISQWKHYEQSASSVGQRFSKLTPNSPKLRLRAIVFSHNCFCHCIHTHILNRPNHLFSHQHRTKSGSVHQLSVIMVTKIRTKS